LGDWLRYITAINRYDGDALEDADDRKTCSDSFSLPPLTCDASTSGVHVHGK